MNEFCYSDIESLCIELPEDILKMKWFGDYEGATALINLWLLKDIPEKQKAKLRIERYILSILPTEYTLTFEEAFTQIKDIISDFTQEEFFCLKDQGNIDWMYVNGEIRYFRRYLSTLLKVNSSIKKRARIVDLLKNEVAMKEKEEQLKVIQILKANKKVAYHFQIRAAVWMKEDNFQPGFVRVHIPLPIACQQVNNIKILRTSTQPYTIASEDTPQRTICFETKLQENEEFFVEYEYNYEVGYVELLESESTSIIPEKLEYDLGEQLPHIMFTPYLKELANELVKGCQNSLAKVRKIYDYITTKIEYSFMREYITIENIPEYAALGKKGDCGVQTLLFITLCRITGIPARWQSGLYTTKYTAGSHDWAQFYIAPYGWLFADCSLGGNAYREKDELRREFYFGNLDPFRMPANREFQREFIPAKAHLRADPYDNQRGEIEYETRGLRYDEFTSEILVSAQEV
jgi:hypothetical protein